MTFPYRAYEVLPTPSIPNGILHRPVIPVRVSGPAGDQVILGLVDTGSDVSVLPAFLLDLLGVQTSGEQGHFRGVGGQFVTALYAEVGLALDHGDGLCRWSAKIGFLDGHDVAILGHAGFLEYFDATFKTARRRLTLKPNNRFPGEIEK